MKTLFTLLITLASLGAFCQIGNNGGATRDDHTTGVENIDVNGSLLVMVVNNQITVSSQNNQVTIGQVRLYDLNGSLIVVKESSASSTASINVSTYSSGIYFVAIETNEKVVTKKIFITSK
jgi:hypothetical protein